MIFVCFVAAVIALMLSPLLPTHEFLTNFSGNLTSAYLYMLGSLCFFTACYHISDQKYRRRSKLFRRPSSYASLTVKNRYLLILACWAVIGTACSLWQIQATTGLARYTDLLSQGGGSAEVARTSSIMLKASEGGLPGYIKIWNQNGTCAVLVLILLIAEGKRIRGVFSYCLVSVIVGSYVGRNFLHMDRLALLAVIPAIIQLWIAGTARTRKLVVMLLVGVVALAQIQSIRRGHGFGSLEFLILYLQLGVLNNSLVIDTFTGGHAWGTFTIFSPLAWLLQAFGRPFAPYFDYRWVWNSAQDLFGYVFFDFGWYGLPVFGLLGIVARYFDNPYGRNKASKEEWRELARTRLKPFLAYAALSAMFVPAFAGPEFWLTALNLALFCWMECRYRRHLFYSRAIRRSPVVPIHTGYRPSALQGKSIA